jgi:hypothetical protein
MILFHGSTIEVNKPEILLPVRTLDFGNAFYTTTNLEQANKWAKIKQKRDNSDKAIVSVFEFDEKILSDNNLNVLVFNNPDEKWLEFILSNRLDFNFYHDYDLIKGPVANDRVYACLNAYENNFMDFQGVVKELKIFLLSDQISFNTKRALEYLKFVNSEEV